MVEWQKMFSFISGRDHCQRSLSHHLESLTRGEQDLNLRKTWVQTWMKLCSSDTHYATVLWSIVRKSAWLCVDWWVSYKAEKLEEGLLTNVMLWRINDQFIKWYFHCKIEVILCQEGEKQEILCFFCKAVQ